MVASSKSGSFAYVAGGGNQKRNYKGGEEILDFSGVSEERKILNDEGEFCPVLEKSGNDLVVIYTNDVNGLKPDSVRLVNYFKTGKKSDIKIKLSENEDAVDIKEFYVSFGYDDFQKGRTITGTFLNDDIDGLQGNDVIKGLDGDDYIKGDGGNDKIYGGTGKNTYAFSSGDGNDTIYSSKGAQDTIIFKDLSDSDSIELSNKGNNLILTYGENKDTITIADYFKNPLNSSVKQLEFNNGSEINLSELVNEPILREGDSENNIIKGWIGNDIIVGGKGSDRLYGGKGKNVFVFKAGDNNDTIYYEGGEDIIDLRNVENLNANEFGENGPLKTEAIKRGNDLIILYTLDYNEETNSYKYDSICLANYFKNGQKYDIKFILKNDAEGNPIYTDLKDFVTVDLAFDEAEKGQKITGTFLDDLIDGSDYNDVIQGSNGNDDIYGGLGNDKLYGDYGNNVFEFDVADYSGEGIAFRGNGKDTIYSGKGSDSIRLLTYIPTDGVNEYGEVQTKPLSTNNLRFSLRGDSLIIHYTDKDSIELADYFKVKGGHSVKEIELYDRDGVNTEKYSIIGLANSDLHQIKGKTNKRNSLKGSHLSDYMVGGNLADTIKGGNGNDYIIGGKGNDKLYGDSGENTFEFYNGDGNDTIYSGKGKDEIIIQDVGEEDVVISKNGKDLIFHYSENDSITISNYFKNPDASSFENIEMRNVERFVKDLISEKGLEYALKINNSKKSDGDFIEGSRLNDSIIGSKGDDFISGDRGHDTLKGGSGDDTIYGGTGNDKLYGEAGDNKIVFKNYDGNDTVYMGKGNDSLLFAENELDYIRYEKFKNNLIVKYGEGDSVTISNYFSSKYKSVDTIATIDDYNNPEPIEKSVSLKKDIIITKSLVNNYMLVDGKHYIPADCYDGNEYNNLIVANNNKKHNFVEAGAGDDIIYCQGKQVIAKGEGGNDTYVISSLKNSTAIYDTEGENYIQIEDKSSNVNLIFNVSTENDLGGYNGMYILNKSTLSSLIKSRNIDKVTSGVEVEEFFSNDGDIGSGAVLQIKTSNGYCVSSDQINEVKANVVSWLSENNYASALDAFEQGDKSSINELVAIYQNINWQQPEV